MNTIKLNRAVSATLVALGAALLGVAPAHAVTTYDLTSGGSVTIGSGIFITTAEQSTGSGVIDPFLRVQANGSETGLNSNEGNADVLADTKTGTWTHDITLANVGTLNIGGTNYYVFLLDVNETTGGGLISLDTFQLYTRTTSITDGVQDSLAQVTAGGNLRFDLDAGTDRAVLLNYNLNSGSGSGDLFVYIPTSLFAADASSSFLYLYTQFGLQPGYGTDDGFEEWSTVRGATARVPDGGATMALLGFGLLCVEGLRRKLKLG